MVEDAACATIFVLGQDATDGGGDTTCAMVVVDGRGGSHGHNIHYMREVTEGYGWGGGGWQCWWR